MTVSLCVARIRLQIGTINEMNEEMDEAVLGTTADVFSFTFAS